MRTIHTSRCLSVAIVLALPGESVAQRIEISAARIQSSNPTVRAQAFYDLVATVSKGQPARSGWVGPRTDLLVGQAKRQPDLAQTLTGLLGRESEIVVGARGGALPTGFDAEGYYSDLCRTVAGMRDPGTIKALMPCMQGDGPLMNAIAGFGDAAVPVLIDALGDNNRNTRASAALTLGLIAARATELHVGSAAIASMRGSLLRVVASVDDAFVRQSAAEALMPLSGDDIRATMELIAATDTATAYAPPGRPRGFPLRAAAKAWLSRHPRSL
jgi:hypothetical protein